MAKKSKANVDDTIILAKSLNLAEKSQNTHNVPNNIIEQFEFLNKSGMTETLEALRKENMQLERVIKDMSVIFSCRNVDSMLDLGISKILDYLVPETFVIMIKQYQNNTFQQYSYKNFVKKQMDFDTEIFSFFKDFFNKNANYYLSGEAVSFEKLLDTVDKKHFSENFLSIEPKYIVPLIGIDGIYGIVFFGNKITGESYNTNELFYIRNIFAAFAVTLQNELNYKNSITDTKTGLYNYSYFEKRLKEKIAHYKRHNSDSAIIMIDIDNFKNFNDTYGHLVGDEILVELSKLLICSVREEDCICRFGGEEFLVLISDCPKSQLFNVAERLRNKIEHLSFTGNNKNLKITISVGACMINTENGKTPHEIIQLVDSALYKSKQSGKNCSTII